MEILSFWDAYPWEILGQNGKTLNRPTQERIIKAGEKTAEKLIQEKQVTEKGKLLERNLVKYCHGHRAISDSWEMS